MIGKQGTTIRAIQETSGARVQLPSTADVGSNPLARTITITGSHECIQRAIHEITQAILAHGGAGGSRLPASTSIHPGPPQQMNMYGGGGGDP